MINKGLMTSIKQDYETDKKLGSILKDTFDFDLDFCANRNNICENYFTKEINCFNQDISKYNMIYCNPPYNEQKKFINYLLDNNKNFVALLPSRTDTKLFHELNNRLDTSIIFLKGRLKFNTKNSAPFPSLIIICTYNEYTHFNYASKLRYELKKNNYL